MVAVNLKKNIFTWREVWEDKTFGGVLSATVFTYLPGKPHSSARLTRQKKNAIVHLCCLLAASAFRNTVPAHSFFIPLIKKNAGILSRA